MKIISKHAKSNVAIGYATGNGCEKIVAYAPTRVLAKYACQYARKFKNTTNREKAKLVIEFLELAKEC